MAEEKKVNSAPAKAVTAVKKDDTRPGFFKRIGKWFREMKSELKKVICLSAANRGCTCCAADLHSR